MKKQTSITIPDEASVAISIKDPEDMTKAVSILSVLNKALDKLTEDREKITKPINQSLKEIRAKYKPAETKLEEKIAEIRSEMSQYQTRLITIQAKKEADLAEKVAQGKMSIEKASDKINSLPEIVSNIQVDQGGVKFKAQKVFEVKDLSQVPIEFHLPNLVAIRAEMLKGKELPGCEYKTIQTPYNSR